LRLTAKTRQFKQQCSARRQSARQRSIDEVTSVHRSSLRSPHARAPKRQDIQQPDSSLRIGGLDSNGAKALQLNSSNGRPRGRSKRRWLDRINEDTRPTPLL
jgi:hypothetical protein